VRTAVLEHFGSPLTLTTRPEPPLAYGDALVRVRATGLCGSDLKVGAGTLPGVTTPLVPGHEVAGELVEAAGDLPAGTRVAVYMFTSCGACGACARGEGTVCPRSRRIGFERDGGLAEYLRVPSSSLLPFGADLPFEAAAVAMDAVLSPWHALISRGRLQAGEKVLVVGAGGLGLHAIQVARALGGVVAVVDPDESHRARALDLGAELVVDPGAAARIAEWAGDGADLALEASGAPEGFRLAVDALRPAGRVVACGYRPGADYSYDSTRAVLNEISILGSRLGSRADAVEALAAVERGAVVPLVADTGRLDDVNTLLGRLAAGEALGRFVVTFT
jgi:2-desacetyl-2-hydroxyethyl bacteriochlorophyllide A dehydrogenase